MEIWIEIIDESDYHVHKGFKKHVTGHFEYLIKTLGLDCEEKKEKKDPKQHSESKYRKPNNKFYDFLKLFVPKKKRKHKPKKRRHEKVEEAV